MVIDLYEIKHLIKSLEIIRTDGDINRKVRGVSYDSRSMTPGSIFICVKGACADGHDFIKEAIDRGASAIITQRWLEVPPSIPQILVKDTRLALAIVASNFFANPSSKLRIVGITGTNGKTTTSYLIKSIFDASGFKSALIGTIEYVIGQKTRLAERTTPESLDLQCLFADMVKEGVSHGVIEVSSHSVELSRVYGIDFAACVFTNLTQDHLDYHGDMESYFLAKRKFFLDNPNSPKIINIDDRYGERLAKEFDNVITTGLKNKADVMACDVNLSATGSNFTVLAKGKKIAVDLRLNAFFNVRNALSAFTVGMALGLDPEEIKTGLEGVSSVPGRFERVDVGQKFEVYIDYAHTPDGLEKLIRNARKIAKGRVIVVFGCGGDRDRRKRPIMGKSASRLADLTIITSDNPRNEDPAMIIDEILVGAVRGKSEIRIEPDRRRAISLALKSAKDGDLVLIAGKGHERGQTILGQTTPFSDKDVAVEILKESYGW